MATVSRAARNERLRALELVFDAGTQRCLQTTGLGLGWRRLEVGAGAGSIRRAFNNVHNAIEVMFSARGLDHAFGARLPSLLLERGFESISIENEAPIVPGGAPHALMMAMSAAQLSDVYVATGFATPADIQRYGRFANDPTCWATYHATIRGIARKPQSSVA